MKHLFKKITAGIIVPVMVLTLLLNVFPMNFAAEDNKELVDICDLNSQSLLYSYDHATLENGELTLKMWEGVGYEVGITLPKALTETYKITGTIKVNDVIATADDDISIWNCIRIVAGRTTQADYNTVSIYRKVGIQIVNFNENVPVGIGEIHPYPEGTEFVPGAVMAFEIYREGRRLAFTLNGTKVIDYTLSEEEDMAAKENHNIIGFQSTNVDYTISDLKVLVDKEAAAAQDPGQTGDGPELVWYDVLDWDSVETQYGATGTEIDRDGKVISMAYWENTPYQYGLLFEGIKPKFRISGKITINDIIDTGDNDISIWNGLRIICGRTDFLTYNTVSMYRLVGMQIVNNSTVGIGPIIPYPEGFSFAAGTEFTFEILKDGRHFIFKLNDAVMIDYTVGKSEDLFVDDAYDNIGFIAINMAYDVTDLKVEVEGEAPTPSPIPTEVPQTPDPEPTVNATAVPTQPATAEPTEVPQKTASGGKTSGGNNSWIWLVIEIAFAVITVAIIVIIISSRKKKKDTQNG